MQKLIAASTELDLEKEVSIPLIFKVSDIKDISKRSGSFSKTIRLPGTEINNKFFGGLHDLNADFTGFNPNIKTPCIFSNDGDEFINGFLQLKQITRDDKKDITYNCVLYDSILTFWGALDKKVLGDLDFSAFDHIYNRANIIASWTGAWNTVGYYYAMHFGTTNTVKTTDFRPAPYKKNVLDRIITDAGYTWAGNLKNNPIFEKEILQSEIDRPTISLSEAASKTFRASRSIDELIYTDNTDATTITPQDFALDLDDEVTPPNDDSNNLWLINKFTAPKVGKYRFRQNEIQLRLEYEYTVNNPNNFTPQAFGNAKADLVTVIKDNLNNVIDTVVDAFFIPTTILNPAGNLRVISSSPQIGNLYSNNLQDIYLDANWTVEVFIRVKGTTLITEFGGNPALKFAMTELRYYVIQGSGFESLFVQYAYEDNVPLTFNDFMNAKFLQKDVIKDIIVRYNCLVYVNPENSKEILFNIRDEFYASAPIKDWTGKKDHNTRDQIKLIGELQNERLLLSYTKGEDATNKSYTNTIGDENIYGQFEYEFANDYVKGDKKILSPYKPTPLVWSPGISAIVPMIHARQPIQGMRVLYVGGLIEVANVSWIFSYRDAAGVLQNATQAGYPYAGHYDHPQTPTIDINFGGLPFPQFYYALPQTTDNNIFNRHWRNTINQIADGRLVIMKFNLKAADVYFVKNNPNTRIFVENKYYYINKIDFEGNENLRKLTTVELLTVEDDILVFTGVTTVIELGDTRNDPPVDPITNDPGNVIDEPNVSLTVAGSDNTIATGNQRINITGNGNFVDKDNSNVVIQGNNNRVFGSNVTIIGVDGLTVRQNNISIINGVVTFGCQTSVLFNKIDGGLDGLTNPNRKCNINKICGELDGEFKKFNVSLFNKIDSDDGITEEI